MGNDPDFERHLYNLLFRQELVKARKAFADKTLSELRVIAAEEAANRDPWEAEQIDLSELLESEREQRQEDRSLNPGKPKDNEREL